MKRPIAFALTLLLVLSLTGCLAITCSWEFLHSSDSITSIEIYSLAEPVDGNIPKDAQPIAYLEQDDFGSFCEDIRNIQLNEYLLFAPVTFDPSWTLEGYVAKVFYENGDYEIICDQGYQFQDVTDGRDYGYHYKFPDDSTWTNLVESYIDEN